MSYQKLVKELSALISFPTVSTSPTEAISSYLAEKLQKQGFEIEYYHCPTDKKRANVLASIGPKNTDGLLLSGHMDVVPIDGQNWQSDPFKLIEKENKLYGRGSVDMKGFIASTMVALENFNKKDFKKELALLWTYDEEIGCCGSRVFKDHFDLKKRNLPKRCIIGEPTEQKMISQHNGIFVFDVELQGKAAHSSQPSWGVNAISDMTKIMQKLDGIQTILKKKQTSQFMQKFLKDSFTTITMAKIEGGLAYNIVPEKAKLVVSVRPIPGIDFSKTKDFIFHELTQLKLKSTIKITEIASSAGLFTSTNSSTEKLLKSFAVDENLQGVAYCTDGGNLQYLNLEPIIFGPGSIEQAHKPDEFISTTEIISFTDKLVNIINKQCLIL